MHNIAIIIQYTVLQTSKLLRDEILKIALQKEVMVMWCDGDVSQWFGGKYIAIYKYIKSMHCTP